MDEIGRLIVGTDFKHCPICNKPSNLFVREKIDLTFDRWNNIAGTPIISTNLECLLCGSKWEAQFKLDKIINL